MNTILEDPGLYLPPSNNLESGVKLFQRLPHDRKEHIRRVKLFFNFNLLLNPLAIFFILNYIQ